MSGIILTLVPPSTIPNPEPGKETIFVDNIGKISTKNSAGIVTPISGDTGAQGPPGPMTILEDGLNGEDGFRILAAPSTFQNTRTIGITIDGSGSVITVGLKGYRSFPSPGIITSVRLFSNINGSIVFDIWKKAFIGFPPLVADSITASAKPTLVSASSYEDITLVGWNKTVNAGDVFAFNINSVATLTRITLELTIVVL